MARLRVDEIEINGSQVTIGGASLVTHEPPATRAATPAPVAAQAIGPGALPEFTALLVRFPVPGRVLMLLGALLCVGGLFAFLRSANPHDIIHYLFGWGLVSSAGATLTGVGAAKGLLQSRHEREERRALEAALAPLLPRLRALLKTPDPAQTVAWIAKRLGTSEELVVRALAALRDQGELQEELNTENGEWFYCTSTWRLKGPRDLDARLCEQERKQGR